MLDIIIVNYESSGFLKQCLRSAYDSSDGIPLNVFVQDNGSKNGIDHVSESFPQINLTKNVYNMGFAKAINPALAKGSAPYILLLNPDTILQDGFFEKILRYIEDNEDAGIIGPKILNLDGTVQGSARSFPTPLTALFGRTSLLSRLFPDNRITRANILTTRSDGITPIEVDWVSGACMLLRRKAMDDVGNLDERFFLYYEDADLCCRMRKFGWKVVYFPQASITHYVGGSSCKRVFRSVIDFHRSSYRLFDKYAKGPFQFMKPLAIGGLSIRLLFVFMQHGVKWLYQKMK